MLPKNNIIEEFDEKWKNTKTYKIDFEKNKIIGMVDGKEAIAQAIYKALNTIRYDFEIYNWNYGCEIVNIIGQSSKDMEALAEKYIEEAVMVDKRVMGIKNFKAERKKNILEIYFVAETTHGDVEIESEVNI